MPVCGPHPFPAPLLGLACGRLDGRLPGLAERGRGLLTEGTVGPLRIVVDPPRLDRRLRLFQGIEPMEVETLVAEAAVERLDEGIIRRLARPGELELDAVAVRPGIQRAR